MKFLLTILMMSSFAMAQVKTDKMKPELSTGGGNGGSLLEIDFLSEKFQLDKIRFEFIKFLSSKVGQNLFSHLDLTETIDYFQDPEIFKLVTKELKDKFDLKRDALNFPDRSKIYVNAKIFQEAIFDKLIYVLILHEVFGLQNIEVNSHVFFQNSYKESIRILPYINSDKVYSLATNEDFRFGDQICGRIKGYKFVAKKVTLGSGLKFVQPLLEIKFENKTKYLHMNYPKTIRSISNQNKKKQRFYVNELLDKKFEIKEALNDLIGDLICIEFIANDLKIGVGENLTEASQNTVKRF